MLWLKQPKVEEEGEEEEKEEKEEEGEEEGEEEEERKEEKRREGSGFNLSLSKEIKCSGLSSFFLAFWLIEFNLDTQL